MNFKIKKLKSHSAKKLGFKKLQNKKSHKKSKSLFIQIVELLNTFSQKEKIRLCAIIIITLFIPIVAFGYNCLNSKIELPNVVAKTLLKTIGSSIKKDDQGYTNFLALGVGGQNHDGGELTDTILIISINEKNKNVVMSSIPRDLYVSHENIISQRINSVYENVKYKQSNEIGYQTLSEIVEEITNIPIHYYIKIDFSGLEDIVNALGGITVYNDETIYDPEYPGPNYTYQTFSLSKGYQNLDGATALKFVRSRKSSSDFARAQRQQKLLVAMKEKALQLNILTSKKNLSNLYQSIEKNLETNLKFGEILTLAGISATIDPNKVNQIVLNDDPFSTGGFLYTPPRSLYKDAYVLLPADKTLSQIHSYFYLHREFPEFMHDPIGIDIINGTKRSGLAGQTALILNRFGFEIHEVKNTENKEIEQLNTKILTSVGKKDIGIKAIQALLPFIDEVQTIDPALPSPDQDGMPAQISILLGTDFIPIFNNLEVYSSLASIIQQAIDENRAISNPQPTETLTVE